MGGKGSGRRPEKEWLLHPLDWAKRCDVYRALACCGYTPAMVDKLFDSSVIRWAVPAGAKHKRYSMEDVRKIVTRHNKAMRDHIAQQDEDAPVL